MLNKFKDMLKKQGNKNFTFVKIRSARICSHCLKTKAKGSECLTVNPKRGSRRWYCEECVQLMLNLNHARAMRESVAFGDEGAEMAFIEWEDEALAELESVRY